MANVASFMCDEPFIVLMLSSFAWILDPYVCMFSSPPIFYLSYSFIYSTPIFLNKKRQTSWYSYESWLHFWKYDEEYPLSSSTSFSYGHEIKT